MSVKRLWSAVLCGYLALGATIQALPGLRLGGVATTGALVTASAFPRPPRPEPPGGSRRLSVGAALVALGTAAHRSCARSRRWRSRGWCSARARRAVHRALAVVRDAPPTRRGRLIKRGLSMWERPRARAGDRRGSAAALVFATAAALAAATTARTLTPPRPPPPATASCFPVALRRELLLGLSSFGYGTLNAFVFTRRHRSRSACSPARSSSPLAAGSWTTMVPSRRPRRDRDGGAALPFIPHPAALIVLGAGLASSSPR